VQSILTFPYLNVYLHTGLCHALETQWHGFATSAEFRQAVSEALTLGHHHRIKGWIADDRLLGAVRPKDLEWVLEKVLHPLNQLGLRRYALLASNDLLNRLTIDRMYSSAQAELTFEIRRFEDIAQARAWACVGS